MRYQTALLYAMVALSAIGLLGATQEGVFFDPASGNYLVRYVDIEGEVQEGFFFPSTKIDPVLTSTLASDATGKVHYEYSVISSTVSLQPLIGLVLPCEGYAPIDQWMAPTGWLVHVGLSNAVPQTRSLRWVYADRTQPPRATPTKGLAPGAKQQGFALTSSALPGVTSACMDGNAQADTFNTQFLDDSTVVGRQIQEKLDELGENDHVKRFAAVPTFKTSAPLQGATVLSQFKDHIATWPQQQLMEQSLWQKIDGLLGAAISALQRNDQPTAASSLAQIRVELRKRYPDLDVNTVLDDPAAKDVPAAPDALNKYLTAHDRRLAANVLDFDVDFVIRRLQLQASGPPTPPDADGPAILLPPESNTMYAPLFDINGTFTVSWSTPLIVSWIGSATVAKLDHYELEYSRSSNFASSTKINAGRELSYQVRNLVKGKYYTRVIPWIGRADNCPGCIGGGSGDQVYDAAPKEPYTGPHETEVVIGP